MAPARSCRSDAASGRRPRQKSKPNCPSWHRRSGHVARTGTTRPLREANQGSNQRAIRGQSGAISGHVARAGTTRPLREANQWAIRG
eukprot:2215062-Prymnesium_polylepis.1